jgi:teichuronic acid biosynthesis glycosyltransferase TuaC
VNSAQQSSGQPLRVLIVTKVFPSKVSMQMGPFNRQQFVALSRRCEVHVLGLIPWYPGARFFAKVSEAGRLQAAPAREIFDGLEVRHPRALFLPRFWHSANPLAFALSLLPEVFPLRKRVDVILGSWAFPDGIAAIHLGQWLGLPTVVKVHGSDLNVLPGHDSIRRVLARRLPRARRLVAVSRPLAAKARELGVESNRIAIVPNGVDRNLFVPRDRAQARQELGLPDGRMILFVGRVEEPKGVLDLLQAFERIAGSAPDLTLAVVGDGGAIAHCREAQTKWPGRVFVPGAQLLPQVAQWIAACDVLALPSWNEGTPNAVLEALASGRQVVATNVGGIPDVLTRPELGEMVEPRRPDQLAEALLRGARRDYDPALVAAAGPPDWNASAEVLHQVLLSARDDSPLPASIKAFA